MFLTPSELGFLRYLKAARVPLNEFEVPENKISNVQSQLEKLVNKNYYLNKSAKDGYRSYLQAYASYSLKSIFDINKLDLAKVAKGFGFTTAPPVNMNLGSMKGSKRTGKDRVGYHIQQVVCGASRATRSIQLFLGHRISHRSAAFK